jgi:two-component system phosphate regulon sensor histidine kinase PhoR
MRLGVRGRFFLVSLAIFTVALGGAEIFLAPLLEKHLKSNLHNDLWIRARLAAKVLRKSTGKESENEPSWKKLAVRLSQLTESRVSIYHCNGVLLGDSLSYSTTGQENRANLQLIEAEVATALAKGYASGVDDQQSHMFVAVPFAEGTGVVRLALPLEKVKEGVDQWHRLLLVFALVGLAIVGVLSALAAHSSTDLLRRLAVSAQRMAGGELNVRSRIQGDDELAVLGKAIDKLAASTLDALQRLKGERDLLQGVLESMQEGVLVINAQGLIEHVNPALREMLMLGVDPQGRAPLEVIRNTELQGLLQQARAGCFTKSAEIELGGIKPRRIMAWASPLTWQPGLVLCVLVDVTAIRMLESLRRDFVANVSHELRTPLASIRCACETLFSCSDDDIQFRQEFLEIIDRNAKRMQSLVDDLLELAKIESRELRLSLEPLQLLHAVEQNIHFFREIARHKSIKLSHQVGEHIQVMADRRALEQILSNLVDNAMKYCPQGSQIQTYSQVVPDNKVRVFVKDNGPGIAPQHIDRLFERFYRVDVGRSRDVGGTGLGLSIVKHLTEAMNGAVGVESKIGEGSAFWIELESVQ